MNNLNIDPFNNVVINLQVVEEKQDASPGKKQECFDLEGEPNLEVTPGRKRKLADLEESPRQKQKRNFDRQKLFLKQQFRVAQALQETNSENAIEEIHRIFPLDTTDLGKAEEKHEEEVWFQSQITFQSPPDTDRLLNSYRVIKKCQSRNFSDPTKIYAVDQGYPVALLEKNTALIGIFEVKGPKSGGIDSGAMKSLEAGILLYQKNAGKRVKKVALLVIKYYKDFIEKNPYYDTDFKSPFVMKPPKYILGLGNTKALMYSYYPMNLNRYLSGDLNLNEKLRSIIQYVRGVKDIHEMGFMHRDLKALNALVKHDKNGAIRVKVADNDTVFPEEVFLQQHTLGMPVAFQGTMRYLPLSNLVMGKEIQTRKTDMYMLGCLIADALSLYDQFITKTTNLPLGTSEMKLEEIVHKLIATPSADRISCTELISMLEALINSAK